MSNSFKASNEQLNTIIKYYQEHQKEVDTETIFFKASTDDFTVLIYSNLTVLFQGKKAKEELAKWIDIPTEKEIDDGYDILSHIGSDEVGCGDYFGPIVVCAAYVKDSDCNYLIDIGVKDSKQLNDNKIKELAEKIKSRIKVASFVLTNKKYNEIRDGYNLNKIKAYLHNFVLYNLSKNVNFNDKIVVDQFCSEDLYYNYLRDYKNENIVKNITFKTKAESKYLAVACASIVARDIFINEIEKLKEETGYNILLGADSKVDDLARKIYEEKGLDFLKNIVKFHFKNTEKILKCE